MKNIFKNTIIFSIVVIMILGMCSCGKKEETDADISSPSSENDGFVTHEYQNLSISLPKHYYEIDNTINNVLAYFGSSEVSVAITVYFYTSEEPVSMGISAVENTLPEDSSYELIERGSNYIEYTRPTVQNGINKMMHFRHYELVDSEGTYVVIFGAEDSKFTENKSLVEEIGKTIEIK